MGSLTAVIPPSEQDLVARYGGEELCVVLTDLDEVDAVSVAEELRQSIARMPGPAVTASFGVSAFGSEIDDARQLIAVADAALYRAKRAGRNRVELGSARSEHATAA